MPTNTIATSVNMTRISQLTMDALMTYGVPLRAFLTDFSPDFEARGESVTASYPVVPTAQDMTVSKAPGNSQLVPISIKLDKYFGVPIGFNDLERTFTDVDLAAKFVDPAVSALVDKIIGDVLSLVTNANGFTDSISKTAAQFDADVVADLAESFSTRKIPANPRTLLVKPTYKAALVKDNAIQVASAYGSNGAIVNNLIPRVHGFDVVEYNGTFPANGENLQAIATHPQALALAARGVVPPDPGTWYGKVKNIVEPVTGLPIQIRQYYDGTHQIFELSVLYGVAKGMPTKLTRIKSA